MCVLACVLHAGDRFRCWKRILRGMKFSVITIYHTVGLGCEEILLDFFLLSFFSKEKILFPTDSQSRGMSGARC